MEFIQREIPAPCAHPSIDLHSLASDDPLITPITVDWQKEKCALLDFPFKEPIDQHSSMAGQKLQAFAPWLCDSIGADGNCLFRCLSKVISGSEEHHAKLRGEICRYMVSDGKDIIGWYFNQVLSTTPSEHLSRTCMYNNGNWGTDAELIAASALLQTDIYVANKIYHSEDSDEAEIRWSRIRASNNNNNNHALYITNYSNHYQPVTRMINSHTPTFFFHDTTPININ